MAEKFSEFGAPQEAQEKHSFKKGDIVTIQRGRFFKTKETGWRIEEIDTRGYAVVKKTDPTTGTKIGESVSLKNLEKWNAEKLDTAPALVDIMHPQEGESSGHTAEDFEYHPLAEEDPEQGKALDKDLTLTPPPFHSDETLILPPVNVPKRPSEEYKEPVAPELRVPSPPPKPKEEKEGGAVYDNDFIGTGERVGGAVLDNDFVGTEVPVRVTQKESPETTRPFKIAPIKTEGPEKTQPFRKIPVREESEGEQVAIKHEDAKTVAVERPKPKSEETPIAIKVSPPSGERLETPPTEQPKSTSDSTIIKIDAADLEAIPPPPPLEKKEEPAPQPVAEGIPAPEAEAKTTPEASSERPKPEPPENLPVFPRSALADVMTSIGPTPEESEKLTELGWSPFLQRAMPAEERKSIIASGERAPSPASRVIEAPVQRVAPEVKPAVIESIKEGEARFEKEREAYLSAHKHLHGTETWKDKYLPWRKSYAQDVIDVKRTTSALLGRDPIQAGDSALQNGPDSAEKENARFRKEIFISHLHNKRGLSTERAEAIYELELKRTEYEHTRRSLAEQLYEERRKGIEAAFGKKSKDFNAGERSWEGKLLHEYKSTVLFDRFIVKEADALFNAGLEEMPPERKGLIMRGIEAFAKVSPIKRRVISAALVTGVVAATGGFASVGIAASYFGMSTAKGLSAIYLGEITGKGIDRIRNFRAISRTAERRNLIKSLGNETNLEDFEKAEEAYREYLVENAKKERKELVAKTLAMAVVGGAASMGMNHLSALYGPDALHTASPAEPTPSPTPKGLPAERPSVTPSPLETPSPTASPTLFPSPSPEATPTPRVSPTPLEAIKSITPQEVAGPSAPDAHLEKLMTVRAGEGAWQPIYRQLEERLHSNPERFNLSQEDLQNAAKVRATLNSETMKVLLKEKFVNGDIEKRISMPGVKVLLGDNGAVRVFDGKPPEQLVYTFKRPTS